MTGIVKGIVIVGAKRTPFGTFGGKLRNTSAIELQTIAAKAAIAAAKVNPELIDSTTIGNVLTLSAPDGGMIARHVALNCGVPEDRPALLVNRLCGSGFQSIVTAIQDILTGTAQICLTGGADSMSQTPYSVRNVRFGVPLGQSPLLEDTLWAGLGDSRCKMSMGMTAEKLGAQYKLTRDEIDEFALRSQKLWKAANDEGRFKEELVSVPLKSKKGVVDFTVDEHPRPETTIEGLKKLPTVFQQNGLVTAGTSSGISDGAGAVVVASESAATKHNLTPLARVVAFSNVGVDPTIMGFGPVPAIRNVLKATGKTLDDIDLIEINEAFGAQALACAKELKIDLNKFNVDGGAIAVGHPLAASGARITAHTVHELRRRKAKYGIVSACIGGGQGIALLIEAL